MDFEVFYEQSRDRFCSIQRLIFLLNIGTTAEKVHKHALSPIKQLALFFNDYKNRPKLDSSLYSSVTTLRDKTCSVRSNDCDWTEKSFHHLTEEAYCIVFDLLDRCIDEKVDELPKKSNDKQPDHWSSVDFDVEENLAFWGKIFDSTSIELMDAIKQLYPWVMSHSWKNHVEKGLESEKDFVETGWQLQSKHEGIHNSVTRPAYTEPVESQAPAKETKVSTPRKKKRVRHSKRDDELKQDWEQARDSGVSKDAFCSGEDITPKELDAAIDRSDYHSGNHRKAK